MHMKQAAITITFLLSFFNIMDSAVKRDEAVQCVVVSLTNLNKSGYDFNHLVDKDIHSAGQHSVGTVVPPSSLQSEVVNGHLNPLISLVQTCDGTVEENDSLSLDSISVAWKSDKQHDAKHHAEHFKPLTRNPELVVAVRSACVGNIVPEAKKPQDEEKYA